jgi:UDP-N-acetylmuramate dehydrogenase
MQTVDSSSAAKLLERFTHLGLRVRSDLLGSACSTFSIGGPLACLIEPKDLSELSTACKLLREEGLVPRILGAGSNLLLPDEGVATPIIRLGQGFRKVNVSASVVEVGAASSLMSLARSVSDAGLSGLEFAGGIPASVGGAVCMNAGAHGGEISQVIESTSVLLADGKVAELSASELCMSYRHTQLPAGAIVFAARFRLVESDKTLTAQRRAAFLAERKLRQPLHLPSAGSVFRNPPGAKSAGALLEGAGLKGFAVGGAAYADSHANWIVNPQRRALASDVKALIQQGQAKVQALNGIALIPEVVCW